MARQSIRIILFLASIALVGVGFVQWFWLEKAFNLKELQFNQSVEIALTGTSQRMLDYNHNQTKLLNPVKQLAEDYFVVRVDDIIDANLLEIFLKEEFQKAQLNLDYEYGIYDCATDRMVYGNFVSQSPQRAKPVRTDLPKWENQNYYFGVRFPSRDSTLVGQMGIWLFSSGVLAFVAVFMIIAMIMILKQKRLSEIQKEFINNMTHEFKTPLSSILASTETLKNLLGNEPDQNQRIFRYLGIIQTEGKRLQNQVEAVLKMANFETTRLRLERINLSELIRKAVEALEPGVHSAGGMLELQLPAQAIFIEGDALHLTNVFSNLVDNALKYNNKGKPLIQISLQISGNRILVKVKDSGDGIPGNQLARIFDKFYRVPTGNLHNVKGFGLGLFYVKSVIQAHGGKIQAESEEGRGTEISFTLPFKAKGE